MCNAIAEIQKGTSPYFVTKLRSGFVVINFFQLWEGYVLLVSRNHVEHLESLGRISREDFMNDMVMIGKAVTHAFSGVERVNYAILGNEIPHLHAHIIPRYGERDPIDPREPIWAAPKSQREARTHTPTPEKRRELVLTLRAEIAGQ